MKTLFITLALLVFNKSTARQISEQGFFKNNNSVAVQSHNKLVFSSNNSGTGRRKEEIIENAVIKPFEFSSLKKALKSLKYEEVLVVVNQSNKQEYQDFVELFSNWINAKHVSDEKAGQTKFRFYFTNSKDAYWVKKLKLQNGVGFVNKYKDVIYQDTSGIKATESSFYYLSDTYTEVERIHYLKLLDNEIIKPKISESQLIKVLSKVRDFAYDLPKYGYGVEVFPAVGENNSIHYKIKATPKQVTELISKLIYRHKTDISIDYKFVNFLLEEYITNNSFFKMMVNKDANTLTNLDFKAINYVAWFSKDIEKELKENNTNLSISAKNYMSSVVSLFTIAANTSDYPKEIQSVISDFLRAKNNNPDLINLYMDILKNDRPEVMVEFFDEYFTNTFNASKNITKQFDALFTDAVTSHNWIVFRQQFSHTCNAVAKKVCDENNKQFLNKAIIWSKVSLELQPNEPLYLNILARLYALKGDKNSAIVTQEKAIAFAEKSLETYAKELPVLKQELVQMKK